MLDHVKKTREHKAKLEEVQKILVFRLERLEAASEVLGALEWFQRESERECGNLSDAHDAYVTLIHRLQTGSDKITKGGFNAAEQALVVDAINSKLAKFWNPLTYVAVALDPRRVREHGQSGADYLPPLPPWDLGDKEMAPEEANADPNSGDVGKSKGKNKGKAQDEPPSAPFSPEVGEGVRHAHSPRQDPVPSRLRGAAPQD